MRTPFSALADRVNSVAISAFENAEICFAGQEPVKGVFENETQTALGMAGFTPRLVLKQQFVPGVSVGSGVVVNGVSYLVAAPIRHDGNGMSYVDLEEQ